MVTERSRTSAPGDESGLRLASPVQYTQAAHLWQLPPLPLCAPGGWLCSTSLGSEASCQSPTRLFPRAPNVLGQHTGRAASQARHQSMHLGPGWTCQWSFSNGDHKQNPGRLGRGLRSAIFCERISASGPSWPSRHDPPRPIGKNTLHFGPRLRSTSRSIRLAVYFHEGGPRLPFQACHR